MDITASPKLDTTDATAIATFLDTFPHTGLSGVLIGSRALQLHCVAAGVPACRPCWAKEDQNLELDAGFNELPCDGEESEASALDSACSDSSDFDVLCQSWQLSHWLVLHQAGETLVDQHLYESMPGKYKLKCRVRNTEVGYHESWEFELDDPRDDKGSTRGMLWHMNHISKEIETPAAVRPSAKATSTVSFHADSLVLYVAPLWMLFALKSAHVYWKIHWEKTVEDLDFIRRHFSENEYETTQGDYAVLRQQLLAVRRAETERRIGASSRANLAMTNEAFFQQSERLVGRMVPHDDVHAAVAYGERPRYELFKHDLALASMDMNMFDAAPLDIRLQTVREEAMVIALERYAIPELVRNVHSVAVEQVNAALFVQYNDQLKEVASSHRWIRTPEVPTCVTSTTINDGHVQVYLSELEEAGEIGCLDSTMLQAMYSRSLQHLSTSLTRGRFRDFAIRHHRQLKWLDRDLEGMLHRLVLQIDWSNEATQQSCRRHVAKASGFQATKDFDTYHNARTLVEQFVVTQLPRVIVDHILLPYLEKEEEQEEEEEEEETYSSSSSEEQEEQEEEEEEEEQEEQEEEEEEEVLSKQSADSQQDVPMDIDNDAPSPSSP